LAPLREAVALDAGAIGPRPGRNDRRHTWKVVREVRLQVRKIRRVGFIRSSKRTPSTSTASDVSGAPWASTPEHLSLMRLGCSGLRRTVSPSLQIASDTFATWTPSLIASSQISARSKRACPHLRRASPRSMAQSFISASAWTVAAPA